MISYSVHMSVALVAAHAAYVLGWVYLQLWVSVVMGGGVGRVNGTERVLSAPGVLSGSFA